MKATAASAQEPLAVNSTSLGWSLVRMIGALAIVFAVFLAGVWLIRNSQRFMARRGIAAKLQIVEAKSLGPRQTIYVIGYEKQRMLVAASPSGISFLSTLPNAENEPEPPATPAPAFSEMLRKALNSK